MCTTSYCLTSFTWQKDLEIHTSQHVSTVHCTEVFPSIESATILKSIPLLTDICIVFSLGLLQIKLLRTFV